MDWSVILVSSLLLFRLKERPGEAVSLQSGLNFGEVTPPVPLFQNQSKPSTDLEACRDAGFSKGQWGLRRWTNELKREVGGLR